MAASGASAGDWLSMRWVKYGCIRGKRLGDLRVRGDHAAHLAVARDQELEAQAKTVNQREPGADPPKAVHSGAKGPLVPLCVELAGLHRDVVAEPLRLLVRIRVAAHVDEESGVVDDFPCSLVEADPLPDPERDEALAEHVLHGLPEAEVDPQRERRHELGEAHPTILHGPGAHDSVTDSTLPSGSLNQANRAPSGAFQTPRSS